jgi:hypothetical protein
MDVHTPHQNPSRPRGPYTRLPRTGRVVYPVCGCHFPECPEHGEGDCPHRAKYAITSKTKVYAADPSGMFVAYFCPGCLAHGQKFMDWAERYRATKLVPRVPVPGENPPCRIIGIKTAKKHFPRVFRGWPEWCRFVVVCKIDGKWKPASRHPTKKSAEEYIAGAKRLGAYGYRSNPAMKRLGTALEIRYKRDIGRKPGYYRHTFTSKPSVYASESKVVVR